LQEIDGATGKTVTMRATSSELAEPEVGAGRDPLFRKGRPLVVDVDEVLVRGSLFPNNVLAKIAHRLASSGRGHELRLRIANLLKFDPSRAPFDRDVVAFLLQVVAEGRPVYLCSATYQESLVSSIAQHLGVFTAWSAAPGSNPVAETEELPSALRQGFDFLGSRTIELPTFAVRVECPVASDKAANSRGDARTWAKLLRVHQYAKNALVLVPLLTAHKFGLVPATTALFAAVAFSLCASSAYILNDLIDIEADRAHPTKRHRPIANGAISASHAALASVLVLAAAVAIASCISFAFCGVLLGYLALTAAYSFWLKRIAIVDIVTLAVLYTIRVIGGAVAIGVTVSEWLLAFSLFLFMSLALVKRYVELDAQPQGSVLAARDYQAGDKSMVAILAAATGFNAVIIFTLYISSEAVRALYSYPQLLWIACPILMYWIGRVMLLAQRGLIDDDPVIFALKDRASWLALAIIGVIMLAAL
jgi:4-hydroxybenzoate polyprenyltransferase